MPGTIYPCCDNPDCPLCYGSGVYDPDRVVREAARVVLGMVATSDLNSDGCRDAIRKLCSLVLAAE